MNPVLVGSLIHFPETRYGRPCLAGTGMSIYTCVNLHRMGYTPEQMQENYDHIPLSHFYAAMAYYYANKDDVDEYMADAEAEALWLQEFDRLHPGENPFESPEYPFK